MALPILDGNQSATTLSTILSGGQHITAHTVVSLGTQAITDMRGAVSGSVVSISNLPATQTIAGTVTANVLAGQYTTITSSSVAIGSNSGLIDISNFPNGAILSVEAQPTGGGNGVYKIQHIDGSGFGATDISVTNIFTGASAVNISASSTYSFRKNQFQTHLRFTYVSGTGGNALYKILAFSESYWNQTIPISISSVTVGNSVTIGSLPAISGTVTANVFGQDANNVGVNVQIPVIAFDEEISSAGVPYVVPVQISNADGTIGSNNSLQISGTVTANLGISATSEYQDFVELIDDATAQAAIGVHIKGQSSGSILGISSSPLVISGTITVGNSVTIASLPAISGTVTANLDPNSFVISSQIESGIGSYAADLANDPFPISGTVTIGSALPAGTNRIGVVTIGGGTVTIGAGTAQIGSVTASIGLNSVGPSVLADSGFSLITRGMMVVGGISTNDVGSDNEYRELKITSTGEALVRGSVTASISGTVPISISSVTVGNSVTIGSLPAISGTVTANTFALQGTAVTTSNFTSTTASTVLANYNATREVLTIFNEGAGNLHICAGATCTTIAYQVRLSAGDYYEVPNHQTTITHSAVFATAGTARVTEVS